MDDKVKEIQMKKRERNIDDNLKDVKAREKGPERDCHRRLLEREVCGRKVSQLFLTFQTKQPFLRKWKNVLSIPSSESMNGSPS